MLQRVKPASDHWSRWLLERRDAGDARQRDLTLGRLADVRDRVLSGAEPLHGATLLDVGTGDGLIGMEALKRVGETGTVIFSDISDSLLDRVREAVQEQGLGAHTRFVNASADDLNAIADMCVDVVTTRSVLIYVADKARAFAAMRRVLRREGRLSVFEPINRLMYPEPSDRFYGYNVAEVQALAQRVKASSDKLRDPAADPMMDFDDRDLVRFAEDAGFARVHVECHIDLGSSSFWEPVNIDALLDSSPNPLAPTVRETIAQALTADEQHRFVMHLADAIAMDDRVHRSAGVYLTAVV
jgi:ubiquinone/menaquinone biosynthesis C-methylase UbiE